MDAKPIITAIRTILDSKESITDKLYKLCQYLEQNISHYDWVGFYFANQSKKTLHLGPYAGDPTDHKIIPFGKGICGQVAETNNTFLVDDVKAQDNYIACSIHVKSEIVVPLFVNGENIGQIDIDSHTRNAFTARDQDLLSKINQKISSRLKADQVDLKSLWI